MSIKDTEFAWQEKSKGFMFEAMPAAQLRVEKPPAAGSETASAISSLSAASNSNSNNSPSHSHSNSNSNSNVNNIHAANYTASSNGSRLFLDSDADIDIFGSVSKGALSAISQPLAVGKNSSWHQPNLFGAASVSGAMPPTFGAASFLEKFGAVAEATQEAENVGMSKFGVGAQRGSFSKRRTSFLDEMGKVSLSEKVSLSGSLNESLGSNYRGSLSERLDNMYKSPAPAGAQNSGAQLSPGAGAQTAVLSNAPSNVPSNIPSNIPSNNPSKISTSMSSTISKIPSPNTITAPASPWNPASAPFTPLFASQILQPQLSSQPFAPGIMPFPGFNPYSSPFTPTAPPSQSVEHVPQEKNEKKQPAKKSTKKSSTPPKRRAHRSQLLEQFRSDKSGKKYTLTDIFEHAVEFAKDQHGSRFIQQQMEHASEEEKEVFFNQIRDIAVDLMTDVFGNYVIQKYFEFGTAIQKDILLDNMKGKILELSLQMYGCRVVQRAIGRITPQQRLSIIFELKDSMVRCVKDQNANHVVQMSIESIPFDKIAFIADSLKNQVYHLSTNPYGCRVIQRLLQYGDLSHQTAILSELSKYTYYVIQDQYGNYVIQHIIENSKLEVNKAEKAKIFKTVKKNLVSFSKHKFASNVVEKSIIYGTMQERDELLCEVLKGINSLDTEKVEDDSPLALMMKDQFANYVIQKLVEIATSSKLKMILIRDIKIYLGQIESSNAYGKHLASIEKLIALSESAAKDLNLP